MKAFRERQGQETHQADAKTRRVEAALNHEQADRVPIGEFFWTRFVERCANEIEGADEEGFTAYHYWDIDLVVLIPNMDPHVTGVEILEQDDEHTLLKTGFGCTIESRPDCPMPAFRDYDTKSFEQLEALELDAPDDKRRWFEAVDDQVNSVMDAVNLNIPSFVDRYGAFCDDFCLVGSVLGPHEMLWRTIGADNVLLKIGEDGQRLAKSVERLGDFLVGIVHAQVAAAPGKLHALYIWGDVAYDGGMLFSPQYWRAAFGPQVQRICDAAHEHGLKTIYHGCGDTRAIFEDLIRVGVDCFNPLEVKAGLDVVDLKRQFGKRMAWNGNIDVRVLSTNDRNQVRAEVLRKLNAAKGGGFILQSDHSVPYTVDPATYDYVIKLTREHGTYPLDLGEFDEDVQETAR